MIFQEFDRKCLILLSLNYAFVEIYSSFKFGKQPVALHQPIPILHPRELNFQLNALQILFLKYVDIIHLVGFT